MKPNEMWLKESTGIVPQFINNTAVSVSTSI